MSFPVQYSVRADYIRNLRDSRSERLVDTTGETLRWHNPQTCDYLVPDYSVLEASEVYSRGEVLRRLRGVEAPFSVLFWASHPELENDDCLVGADYDTVEEALEAFREECFDYSIAFIELDGVALPDGSNLLRENPHYNARQVKRDRATDNAEWRREIEHQAGMLGGIE